MLACASSCSPMATNDLSDDSSATITVPEDYKVTAADKDGKITLTFKPVDGVVT